ncbi:MAG: DCC1-like thiol-disulfide oxidoreductase family protein, partial [Geminicoccaceae bacterium]
GSAVYYALQLDQFATPIGHWLLQLTVILPILTYSVWFLELLGPLLIFSPIYRVPVRMTVMFLFLSMELGFAACLYIGLFPLISMTSILIFLPTEIWDRISRYLRRPQQVTIYYDQGCDFCRKACLLLRTFLVLGDTEIIPAQTVPAVARILKEEDSWVVENRLGQRSLRTKAMAEILQSSPWLWWFGSVLSLAPVNKACDWVYNWVAGNRRTWSRATARFLPIREIYYPGRMSQYVALGFLIFVTYWNVTTLKQTNIGFPHQLHVIKDILRLDQHWSMFAPHPRTDDGWFVIPGVLMDNSQVDVFSGDLSPAAFAKPENVAGQFPSYRWRKYLTRLWLRRYSEYRLYYGRYLCRQWNHNTPPARQLRMFKIYYVEERTLPDYRESQPKQHMIWRHFCFDDDLPRYGQ